MTAKTKVTGGHLETWVRSLGWEDPLEKGMAATPVFWPGESHGLYSPQDHKEFDISERLSLSLYPVKGFSGGASDKESTCQCKRYKRCGFDLWVGKIPCRKAW